MKINCEYQSTIFLEKNPTYHYKNMNTDVHYHFLRVMVEGNKVLLEKLNTLENITNYLTKSMSVVKLLELVGKSGYVSFLGKATWCFITCNYIKPAFGMFGGS